MSCSQKLIFSLLILLGILSSASVNAKTYVLLTVDVESRAQGGPSKHIWGQFEGLDEKWGITKIMDVLERHDAKGTFYLNVYEYVKHGESPIRSAANAINNRGHDLQLHTHPKPMYGVYGMSHATYEEQLEILNKGIDLIRDWTGKTVIAHRAGAFKANVETIKAVRDSGLLVDSSLAVVSPLADEGFLSNRVTKIQGVIELPITFFNQAKFWNWASKRSIDIEGITLREFKEILNQASVNGLCSVNIMMHSFSLTRYGTPDSDVEARLDDLLEYINGHDKLELATTTDLYRMIEAGEACIDEAEFVPTTGFLLTYLRAIEDFDKGPKNKLISLGVPVVLIVLILGFIGLFLYSKRNRRLP